MDITFYCQACNHAIALESFATLNEGRCPQCESLEGFSTEPKGSIDPFASVTVINDAELLSKVNA